MPFSPRKARLLLKQKKANIMDISLLIVGFVSGFTSGGAYIKDIEDNYITIPGKTYKQVSFKHIKCVKHQNNWQFIHLSPYEA